MSALRKTRQWWAWILVSFGTTLVPGYSQPPAPWNTTAGVIFQPSADTGIGEQIRAAAVVVRPKAKNGSGMVGAAGGVQVKLVRHGTYDVRLPMPQLADGQIPVWYAINTSPKEALVEYRLQDQGDGTVCVNARLRGKQDQEITLEWASIILVAGKMVTPNQTRPEPYLRATPCAESADPQIKALADKLWPTTGKTEDYARNVQGFIRDMKPKTQPLSFDAVGILNSGQNTICTANANLACALLRAKNIPCRSLAVIPPISRRLEMHRTVEYCENGNWIAFDPSLVQADIPLKPWQNIVMAKTTIQDEETSMEPRLGAMVGCPFGQELEIAQPGLILSGNDFFWTLATPLVGYETSDEEIKLAADAWREYLKGGRSGVAQRHAVAFLAWNMSYKIAVTFHSPEDRWRWVKCGLELLRNAALDSTPGDPDVYKEVAWIYLHKMGPDADEANRYYKLQMATQMTDILGEPPADWAVLAAVPASAEELRTALGAKTVFWQKLDQAKLTFDDLERAFHKAGTFPAGLQANTLPATEISTIERCLRRRWLNAAFRLDPARVQALNQLYGKLDWRLPQAHALYWAHRGIEVAPGHNDLGCERIIFQGLNAACHSGRLIFLRDIQAFETTPNLDLLPAADKIYLDSMAKNPENSSIKGGYENFLIDAIMDLYTFGQRKRAETYLGTGRRLYPGPRFAQNLDDFALAELGEDMGTANYPQAEETVRGYLVQSYYALVLGDKDRSAAFELIASRLWQEYMKGTGKSQERRGLPPYTSIKTNAAELCLLIFPPGLAGRLRELLPKAPAGSAAPPPGTPAPPAAEPVPM